MKSKTKQQLKKSDISLLVNKHFGTRNFHISELNGGMFNTIYQIYFEDTNQTVILKVGAVFNQCLLSYEQDLIPVEVECYHLIQEHTSIPTPNVLAYDFSKKEIPSHYFFMTALQGAPLSKIKHSLSKKELSQIRRQQASYLTQLHEIHGQYFGYFTDEDSKQYSTWRNAFLAMFQQLLQDAHQRNIRLPYDQIAAVLEKNTDLLTQVERPSLVMFDCHDGNLLVKNNGNGYEVEGILDFERAFWGDPIADLSAPFVFTDNILSKTDFIQGYLKLHHKNSFSDDDNRKYQLYRLYLMTIMACEVGRYGFFYGLLQGLWAKREIKKCLKKLNLFTSLNPISTIK
ncbi:phosphotransferase family protein [Beduini massiliensis]|uniref:phosphotransferase family protein n=1 Tax=Beduini massiliensis TaxID=1585974 RepID=UPI000693255B|nr:aminoglycoside phosphotransferase family protein [Beduini massiliensis]